MTSLTSDTLEDIKAHSFPVKTNTFITNSGVFFKTIIVPETLYRLQRYDILLGFKDAQADAITTQKEIIVYKEMIVTNIETKLVYQKELDRVRRKKVIMVSSVISAILSATLTGTVFSAISRR